MRDGGCFQGWGDGAVWENQEDAVQNFEVGWTQTGNVWSKEFTFSTYPVSGTGQIYALFNLTEGSPAVAGFTLSTVDLFTDCSSGDPEPPAVTGICATSTYTSNVAGYDIHAQVTKGVNKYYLTLTSATDGKTITGLDGDNMFCHQYSEEARSHALNYHMAAAGHYAISEGAITFTIPSVGDPDMYTPINVRFSDNTACEITGLNGVRLVPCSTEDPVPYDPDPSVINDVNFASISNGAVAYASDGNPWEAIDNNNGTRWETAASDPQWFIVDLGQRRIFNTIQIRWEGAYGKTFTIDVSNDASSWTTVKSVTNQELEGFPYEQQFDIDQTTARYVRFYGTARGTGYGYSFWEFRVIKATTPVLTTYTASLPSPFCPLGSNYQVTVTAKDQIGNDFPVETTFSVSPVGAGTITSAGVYTPSVVGVATITAEGGGMSSSVVVHNEVSDNLALNQPVTAGHSADVAFSADKANNTNIKDRWASGGAAVHYNGGANPNFEDWWYVDLGGKYDISEIAIKWETARPNDYDIRVSDDASSWTNIGVFNTYPAANDDNSTNYEYYNSSLSSIPGRYIGVWARNGYDNMAYGISMYDFQVFGTENVSSNKYVSAISSPVAGGTVTVTAAGSPVTEVPSGTEVTFTATPNSGYDFVNWTQGGVEVSTSLEYSTTITSNTALVANFEVARTAYCATPVTDTEGRTLYLTISSPSANTYKVLFEGSADNQIGSNDVYENTQFRLRNVNGVAVYHFAYKGDREASDWHVTAADENSYGSAYILFTADDFREISVYQQGVDLIRAAGGLSSFNAFPDVSTIKWDATCTDEEAPVLVAPTATPLSGTSVRLAVSATDDMAALLTYNVNYKPEGDAGAGTDLDFNGTAGEVTYKNIKGLSAGVRYQFSVTVSDGTNTSAAQVCYAKPTMPTAPVPAHNANLVRSIYSDKYESALAHDFQKDSWHGYDLTYVEVNMGGDHALVYDLVPYNQDAWFSWGAIDGANAIIAKDGYSDGEHDGLDASGMDYLHIDIMSANAAPYAEIQIMDVKLGDIPLTGSGWQSFDLPLATFKAAHADKIADINHMKFVGFRGPNNPEEIAIDNVYFWSEGVQTTPVMGGDDATGGWATFSSSSKVSVPSGVTAYKATYSNEGGDEQLVLDAVSGAIPANEGVLLRGEADHVYTFSPTNDAAGDYTGNALVGCPVRTDITSVAATNDIFCLRYSDIFQITGFYLYSGQYIAAGKAYLPLAKAEPSSAPRRIRFVFREEQGTTGFDPTNAEAVPTTKFIENGQLYIRRGDAVYTIQGVRVK
ncbi:MAG: discoidin domain-containing protein [Paludibacteraceae bacterium]|nr:discoidin domain-containing protein [Paludibacteraceae bacterium]